eukprot:1155203-Pelagomonas_calceolata.AAC.2
MCPLPGCHQLDSALYMLSGCQNHTISNMKTERHNIAGRMITKALSKSPVGAGHVYTACVPSSGNKLVGILYGMGMKFVSKFNGTAVVKSQLFELIECHSSVRSV